MKNALSDTAVSKAKPGQKTTRMYDGEGLYLLVNSDASKWWRFDYSIHGKRKTLSLGVYPAVGLKAAREKADAAREKVAAGTDPSDTRKAEKVKATKAKEAAERIENGLPPVDSFEAVAREWFENYKPAWALSHSSKIIRRLEVDIFPWIGRLQFDQIAAPDVLACLRRIEDRGAPETAHRAQQNCGQVFRYAIQTGRTRYNPVPDCRGALAPVREKHRAALTAPADVAELLRAIDGFRGTFVVQCALKLAPLFFVRPGELRQAQWAEFDLDKAEWRFITSKTKSEHLVPLAEQAVAILRDLQALTGTGRYVFSGARSDGKPMSEAAVNAALRRMGYDTKTEITGHGFRAMARTILHEELSFAPEVIEHQLAHKVADALGTAYNRTKFLKERRAMMQHWADYLDELKAGATVIPMQGHAA